MSRALPSALAMMFKPPAPRLPAGPSSILVIDGRKVTSSTQLGTADDDPERAAEMAREVKRARGRARYQRDRLDPAKVARRAAYAAEHREELRAYKRRYLIENRDRIREVQASWAARQRAIDRDTFNARQREYYARNREKVIERCRQQRLARKGSDMSGHQTRPRWTAARQAWLETVETDPHNSRSRGQVGYQCMQLGWTKWQRHEDGALRVSEELTDAGRAVLAQWRAASTDLSPTP